MKDARIEERVEELKTLIKRDDEALEIGLAQGIFYSGDKTVYVSVDDTL